MPVGPVVFTGTADPDAVAIDEETATIPAVRVPVTLSATRDVQGDRQARGVVVRDGPGPLDELRSHAVLHDPAGDAVARTPGGIAFATQEAVFLPVAILDLPRITCQNRTVAVRALRDGPAGNVRRGHDHAWFRAPTTAS